MSSDAGRRRHSISAEPDTPDSSRDRPADSGPQSSRNLLHRWTGRIQVSLFGFVAAVCFGNLLLFQQPLLSYAVPLSGFPSPQGWAVLATIEMIQFCFMASLLFFVSLFSSAVLRIFCSVLFVTNAAALYFMVTYGVQLDRTMIGNILNTDSREATELWHPMALVYLAGLGALPSVFILRAKIRMVRWFWRLLAALGALGIFAAWYFAVSFTWLWFDRYASSLGGKVLPWSYIINTARYASRAMLDNRVQLDLPDAVFIDDDGESREFVVLVIGEASRAVSHSYYGYRRETNPFTVEKGMQALPPGESCTTYTRGSVACIVTHEGSEAPPWTVHEPLPSYLARHGIETIVRTNNTGLPPVNADRQEKLHEIAASCQASDCPEHWYDTGLLWELDDHLRQSDSRRIFVLLQLTGSHGPAYYTKYPPEFETFTPVCETVQLADCTQEQLVNSYDNTIRFTDSLLAELISILESFEDVSSTVIYVSDHGQSLGEKGFYLHGSPVAIAPEEQRVIPFLVWMSEIFRQRHGIGGEGLSVSEPHPHDYPFHSVMGAFGMRSDIYKPEFDIFGPAVN